MQDVSRYAYVEGTVQQRFTLNRVEPEWLATLTTDPKVRGSNLGLEEIFVICCSVSPIHTESEKKGKQPVCGA